MIEALATAAVEIGPPPAEAASLVHADSAQPSGDALHRLRSVLGVALVLGVAWLFSGARSRISWRPVAWGMALQFAFALLMLNTPIGVAAFEWANGVVMAILTFALEGGSFLFGSLITDNIPVGTHPPPGSAEGVFVPETGRVARTGAFFAFVIFPNIIFVSSLMALLYHFGIMQIVVRTAARVMQASMRTSGAETVCAAANGFTGLMESPLTVRPYLSRMTESELMTVMTVGMATISGGTLVAYAAMLLPHAPDIVGHIIAAAIMSVPAAVVVSKLVVPETETPVTRGRSLKTLGSGTSATNAVDAAARGAAEGLQLSLVVGSMIIAFVALVAVMNGLVGWLGGFVGSPGASIEGTLGFLLAPAAWTLGIPWEDAALAGRMIGIDFVLNEFVAFIQLEEELRAGGGIAGGVIGERSLVILVYAMTTYANFGSVAMTLAGIGAVAPKRRGDLARLGLRAAVAGLLASMLTAAIAGMLA